MSRSHHRKARNLPPEERRILRQHCKPFPTVETSSLVNAKLLKLQLERSCQYWHQWPTGSHIPLLVWLQNVFCSWTASNITEKICRCCPSRRDGYQESAPKEGSWGTHFRSKARSVRRASIVDISGWCVFKVSCLWRLFPHWLRHMGSSGVLPQVDLPKSQAHRGHKTNRN